MSSNFKIVKRIDWCTDLPIGIRDRESPVFMIKGNEWFFRFALRFDTEWSYEDELEMHLSYENKVEPYWSYELYLEQKNARTGYESYRVNFMVGYENDETFNLGEGAFIIPEYGSGGTILVWCHCRLDRQRKIKFRFYIDNAVEPLLTNSSETERQTETDAAYQVPKENELSKNSRKNIHFEALSRDISKMLDESSDYDVEIRCEGETFQAHRNILGTRSPVFSAMLNSNMVEGETGLINVEEINASIFRSFLSYLYSGTLPELSVDIAKQLYEVGDRYAVEELKTACSEYLANNLDEDNVCEILVLADQHSDRDLRKTAIAFMSDKKIPEKNSGWLDFCESHSKLANQVIRYYRRNRSR